MFGKPEKRTFDYAKEKVSKKASDLGHDISNFWMIGDNPKADIKGGNDNDCKTILVRTGVWRGVDNNGELELNDKENPADFVADDMSEAYKIILREENLS